MFRFLLEPSPYPELSLTAQKFQMRMFLFLHKNTDYRHDWHKKLVLLQQLIGLAAATSSLVPLMAFTFAPCASICASFLGEVFALT